MRSSRIEKLSIKTAKSKAIIGGSYIPLPEFIQNKRACVNIKNTDEKCFIWSLLAYKYYSTFKKGCGLKSYEYKKYEKDIIEPEGVTYPVEIDFMPEFERLNNLKINIFQLVDEALTEDDEDYDKNNTIFKQFPKKILYTS